MAGLTPNCFDVQLLLSQKTKAVENVSKPPPETQAGGEVEKDVAAKTEPRRVKIFDGG